MIIILYIMDSLRADFLSCYGYHKETSPHIDLLAREGVMFTHAFSQSTWTRASAASILTSMYPSAHGLMNLDHSLPDAVPTLPEEMKRIGFHTVALSSMVNVSPYFGFGKGFDRFVELYREERVKNRREVIKNVPGIGKIPTPTSEDINDFLFPYLREGKDRDIFVFIWSTDTHDPYFHRDKEIAKFSLPVDEILWVEEVMSMHSNEQVDRLKALYEDMIYYNDHQIGCLIEQLKTWDLFDSTFLVLSGDHGESFGEHDVNSHGGVPFDEVIKIPLIMKFPHSRYRGLINDLVQHIDIAPTMIECLGVDKCYPWFQGASLFPLFREGKKVNNFAFTETQLNPRQPKYYSLRTEDYKFMEARPGSFTVREWMKEKENLWPLTWFVYRPRWLYSLREDPAEKVNVYAQKKEVSRTLRASLASLLKENGKMFHGELKRRPAGDQNIDDDVAKQLQALGYFD